MSHEIKVPSAGESVHEGDIARWYKEDGDLVKQDEPLAEIETDKASQDIYAPVSGRLSIKETEGTTVNVGQVIAVIEEVAEGEAKKSEPRQTETADAEADVDDEEGVDDEEDDEEDKAKHSTLFNFQMPSPAARKLMAEHNVSAKDVPATGRGNRITKADVLRFVEDRQKQDRVTETVKLYREKLDKAIEERQAARARKESGDAEAPKAEKSAEVPKAEKPAAPAPAPAAAPKAEAAPAPAPKPAEKPAPPPERPVSSGKREVRLDKMSRLRKTIAERLVDAQHNAALLTTFNEVDMSAIMDLRKQFKDEFKEKHQVGLGFMSFFTKAVCNALLEFPIVNAQVEGDQIKYHDYCDIGIAVSTPKGLVVPVIRDAERLTLRQIELAVLDLAKRGRDGKLSIEDMSGGTFSITNGGIFGSMLSTPILNAPQSAILGMHNIVERPVAKNGQVVIAPVMYLALTYDHRIIDGADAVRFLVRVKNQLENPMRLLLDL